MKIKYVFFDLGLTLAENNYCENFNNILIKSNIIKSISDIELAYHLANKYFMRELPGALGKKSEQTQKDYLLKMCEYLNIQDNFDLVYNTAKTLKQKNIWKSFSFSKEVLEQLHNMGIKTGLISNWDLACKDVLKSIQLDSLLNPIIVSAEIDCEKPASFIFETALKQAGITADECLYVGDNYYDDVQGSNKLGIDCLLINKFGRTGIEELTYTKVITDVRSVPEYIIENYS